MPSVMAGDRNIALAVPSAMHRRMAANSGGNGEDVAASGYLDLIKKYKCFLI